MKRLEQICKELDNKLNKRYGDFGCIMCSIEGDHVKVIIEENYYLYECIYDEEVDDYISNILKKYDTYYEFENSCILTIF